VEGPAADPGRARFADWRLFPVLVTIFCAAIAHHRLVN
jgi:hypothetical protein